MTSSSPMAKNLNYSVLKVQAYSLVLSGVSPLLWMGMMRLTLSLKEAKVSGGQLNLTVATIGYQPLRSRVLRVGKLMLETLKTSRSM